MIQQENLKKRLARLAAPIFIETLLIMMLGAVDTVMLSRHSDNSVAAVGVVNQIIMLTFLVFEVINLGTSVLCSQYIGARLHKQVVQVVGVSLLVNFAVGVGISMLLFGCAEPILRLMGLGPELMQDGMDYMRIVGAFAFFQALSLTLSASLRSADAGDGGGECVEYNRQLFLDFRTFRLSGIGSGGGGHLYGFQ